MHGMYTADAEWICVHLELPPILKAAGACVWWGWPASFLLTPCAVFMLRRRKGIGADALITLKFHNKREANPGAFKSRFMNKIKYGLQGAGVIMGRQTKKMTDSMTLVSFLVFWCVLFFPPFLCFGVSSSSLPFFRCDILYQTSHGAALLYRSVTGLTTRPSFGRKSLAPLLF